VVGKPTVMWQIPLGNSAQNNTINHWWRAARHCDDWKVVERALARLSISKDRLRTD
jgi:hypothetical protein